MDRDAAERALGIIREVIQNTRDDLVAHNWGLIWIIHSFTNFAAVACETWIDHRQFAVWWYLVPLAIVGVVNLTIVQVVAERDRGVRSYIEWQLHGIIVAFVIFTAVGNVVLLLADAKPTLFGPIFAMTSGIAFAMMGVVFYRRLLIYAALFLIAMLAAARWPQIQWCLIGLAWWAGLFFQGLSMHRERRLRTQDGNAARIV